MTAIQWAAWPGRVARPALGKGGSRWLPVRHPEAYAGDVFRTLAEAQGIRLPKPEVARALPSGEALVSTASEELRPLLKDWLDQHLPALVERLVRVEIERVVGRALS